MTAADAVFVDTNVLLAATDADRQGHALARDLFEKWVTRGRVIHTSPQLMREYLAVATRPVAANGLGLAIEGALTNIRAFRARSTMLPEDQRVADRLMALVGDVTCKGKQVHDANIVATMLVHGIKLLITDNVDDFRRFDGHVALMELGGVADW